jgi:cytochrome oxidase assembly protein ShyY1
LHPIIAMAHSPTNDLYPPPEIPKRHTPWFIQVMVAFAVLVLAAVVYGFWQMGKMPARTLELPTTEEPGRAPVDNPPQERPQRSSPLPTPITPLPTPATP